MYCHFDRCRGQLARKLVNSGAQSWRFGALLQLVGKTRENRFASERTRQFVPPSGDKSRNKVARLIHAAITRGSRSHRPRHKRESENNASPASRRAGRRKFPLEPLGNLDHTRSRCSGPENKKNELEIAIFHEVARALNNERITTRAAWKARSFAHPSASANKRAEIRHDEPAV